jgi:hypothetical protein
MFVSDLLGEPFNEAPTPDVFAPLGPMHAAIDGHQYVLDLPDKYAWETMRALRDAQDTGAQPGEQSLSTEAAWNRIQTDWSDGAGQEFFDGDTALRTRFWRSQGISIDRQGEFRLQARRFDYDGSNDLSQLSATLSHPSGNQFLQVGSYDQAINQILITSWSYDNGGGMTPIPGLAQILTLSDTEDIVSLSVLGQHYVLLHTAGWYANLLDNSVFTWPITFSVANVTRASGVVKDRLILHVKSGTAFPWTSDIREYNLLTGTQVGTDIVDAQLYGYEGVGFAEGINHGYMAFSRGDQSLLYKVGVAAGGGTGLSATLACPPLKQETITDIALDQSLVVIGTTNGVRLGEIGPDGNLNFGPLLEHWNVGRITIAGGFAYLTTDDVHARVVGLDPTPGVIRLDLGRFLDDAALVPQWVVHATDPLITTDSAIAAHEHMGNGTVDDPPGIHVTWITTVGWGQVFSGAAQTVAEGWLETGWLDFGLPHKKVLVDLETTWKPDASVVNAVEVSLKYEDADELWIPVGTLTIGDRRSAGDTPMVMPVISPRRFALRFRLLATDPTVNPTVRSWNLRALPVVSRTEEVVLPIVMRSGVRAGAPDSGVPLIYDVQAEIDFLRDLIGTGQVVTLRVGANSYAARVNGLKHNAESLGEANTLFDGIVYTSVLVFR